MVCCGLRFMKSLNVRETVLTIVSLLFVAWAVWDTWSYQPELKRLSKLQEKLTQETRRQADLLKAISSTPERIANNPRIKQQRRNEKLRADIANAETESRRLVGTFIAPDELPEVLEQLVTETSGLSLVDVTLRAPTPYEPPGQVEKQEKDDHTAEVRQEIRLHAHHAELVVTGGYHQVLAYLSELSDSSWRFFYSSLDYETQEYPDAKVTLRLFTVSIAPR